MVWAKVAVVASLPHAARLEGDLQVSSEQGIIMIMIMIMIVASIYTMPHAQPLSAERVTEGKSDIRSLEFAGVAWPQ